MRQENRLMKPSAMFRQVAMSALAMRQWSPRRQIGAMKAFVRYAETFERAYAADDWSLLAGCIDERAVWTVSDAEPPIGGSFVGRDAVLGAIARSVSFFDRRFDQRLPRATEGPIPIPGGIYLGWAVVYRRSGLPDVELRGSEWDFFRDGKLLMHWETFANAAEVLDYLRTHEARLVPALNMPSGL
jgi:hypothetical protein